MIYHCLRCLYSWRQKPQPVYGITGYLIGFSLAASCPKCGHDYVKAEAA
jgi:hypothetical protein